jgi:xylulokinase
MPIATGGHDQACGALGVGVVGEGPVMDASGSVECIAAAMGKPVVTEDMMGFGQCCNCHTVEGTYLTLGFFPSSGIVLRWYRDTFGEKEKEEAERSDVDVYDVLTTEASKSPPGADGLMLLPHLFGSGTGQPPTLNRNSRGAIIGLSMFHDRASVIRAILEGVALELRRVIEFIEVCGIPATELRAVGGGARSPMWLQVKSNVTNRALVRPNVTEAPSLGAAILAGVGTGVYRGFENAVQTVYSEESRIEPDPDLVPMYDRQYRIYKEIYPALVGIYDDLAEFRSNDN